MYYISLSDCGRLHEDDGRFTFFWSGIEAIFNSIHHISFASPCSSSGFTFVGVMLAYLATRCTATIVICFHWTLLVFSHHFSSSSAFLRVFFTQIPPPHHSCGLPRFLQPCFFLSDIFKLRNNQTVRNDYMWLQQ